MVLCERLRDEGLRLESAGDNLASDGPSSLGVVRSVASWPDP